MDIIGREESINKRTASVRRTRRHNAMMMKIMDSDNGDYINMLLLPINIKSKQNYFSTDMFFSVHYHITTACTLKKVSVILSRLLSRKY